VRLNILLGGQHPQRRDYEAVDDAKLDAVRVHPVAGSVFRLVLHECAAGDRVAWCADDDFQASPIARRLPSRGYGRLQVTNEQQRAPMFVASCVESRGTIRLRHGDGQLLAYLTLYSPRVLQPLEFPANPEVVRAVLADCYIRESDAVYEFEPCRGWHNPSTSQMVPLGESLLPLPGTVYYLPREGPNLFPTEALVVSRAVSFVIFDGCLLNVYRLRADEAGGILDLLRRAKG